MRKYLVWTNDSFSIINNKLWVTPFNANVLCRFDIQSNKLQKCFVWKETHCAKAASCNITDWQNKIVVIPARDNVIRVLSQDDIIQEYVIDESGSLGEHYNVTLSWKDKLFIFPIAETNIVELSEKGMRKIPFRAGTVISVSLYNESIFIITEGGCVWQYDPVQEQVEKILDNDKIHFCWMGVWKNDMVFSTKEGFLLLAPNGDMKRMIEIGKAPEQTYFVNGLARKDKILLFLNKDAERIYSFHFPNRCMYEYMIERDKYWNEEWEYNAFGKPCISDGKVYIMSPKHRALFVLGEEGRVQERRHLVLDAAKEIRSQIAKQGFSVSQTIEENELLALEDYLQCLLEKSK